jgi:hypothetical protein
MGLDPTVLLLGAGLATVSCVAAAAGAASVGHLEPQVRRVANGYDVVGIRGLGVVAVGADGVTGQYRSAPCFVCRIVAALVSGTAVQLIPLTV